MRKYLLIVALVCTPLFISAQTYDFNKDGKRGGWNFGGGTVDVKDGSFVFSLDGSSKNPNIRKSKFKTADAQYLHIILKNNTNVVNLLRFNCKDESGKTKFINVEITNTDKEFKTYTVYLGDEPAWKGVHSANLRFTNNKDKVTGTIEIDKIVFDNNSSL